MSAFLCSNTHFQALGATMLHHAVAGRSDLWPATHEFLTNVTGDDRWTGDEEQTEQVTARVIQLLADLNRLALVTRYGDAFDRGQAVPSPTDGRQLGPIAFVKALSCLIYQCSEYLAADTKLYVHLINYRNSIAVGIVAKRPDYKDADWELAA